MRVGGEVLVIGPGEGQRERAGVVVGVVLVQHPVEIELHRFGVERRAVVEGDALAQGEGVFCSVVRDRPFRRQRRCHFERALLVLQETLVEVHEDAEVVNCGRVERLGLGDLAHHQHAGRGLGGGRGREARGHQGAHGGREQAPAGSFEGLHVKLSRLVCVRRIYRDQFFLGQIFMIDTRNRSSEET